MPVQLVASLTSQSSVVDPSVGIVAGVAVSVTVGTGAMVTVALTGWLFAPPSPEHDIE